MSNARELALLEKWSTSSSNGAKIIPPLSSPTSPKATKFCCCPNRRRYNLKQPKLTTTLHVRNIFVDNDFNFIDDTTENDDDDNDYDEVQPTNNEDEDIFNLESTKNYKRAESWPSARRATRPNKSTLIKVEVHNRENRNEGNVTANNRTTTNNNNDDDGDYDDVIEIASEKRTENDEEQRAEKTEEWRHDKSCHNNRNNCLTKQQQLPHERKSNNSRCSIEESSSSHKDEANNQKQRRHHIQTLQQQSSGGNEVSEAAQTTKPTAADPHKAIDCRNKKCCEKLQNTLTNLDDQIATAAAAATLATTKTTSPLIQRLSELSEFNRKETFSNKQPTATQHQQQQQCNNCQFCFNQSCRHFSQLQQSLQDDTNNSRQQQQQHQQFTTSTSSDNQKMTITTATNVANNFKHSIASNSAATTNDNSEIATSPYGVAANDYGLTSMTAGSNTTSRIVPTTLLLASTTGRMPTTTNATNINNITSPTSPKPPIPPPRSNTPSSPLTTTVIKTTMVKRSPANESTTTTPTTATSPSATSASLTLDKSLAFITAIAGTNTISSSSSSSNNNVQDLVGAAIAAKENRPANNKCLIDAPTTTTSSAPLSVKERIAALTAGNEQNQKQHDNFINRTSLKNQCNKPMRSTSQNMTCPQRQHEQSIVINGNNTASNMCQKSPASNNTAKAAILSTVHHDGNDADTDCVDGVVSSAVAANAPKEDVNDNINHKSSSTATSPSTAVALSFSSSSSSLPSSTATAAVVLRSSKPGSAATVPRCSLTNHLQLHNKYGSNAQTSSSTAAAAATTTTAATFSANAMTVDKQPQQMPILSNNNAAAAAATLSSSSSNDTAGNSSDLTTKARNLMASSCRSKLAALDNLDLALNLSDLPLDVDDDDDPYFVLQEYLERVKHEINEVFELHKARQKLQHQQPQPLESDTNATSATTVATIENQIIDTLKAAVSNDELSRSTESDSGFDSATGGGGHTAATVTFNNGGNNSSSSSNSIAPPTNGGSNKLPSRAKVTTSNEKENDNNAKRIDHDNTRVMENSTKNGQTQQQQHRPLATLANNSKEAKPPPKSALIPLREQGKQEQEEDAAATKSLPCSSSSASTASSSTLKRLRKQLQIKSPAEVATDDVNMWANKFLRDLDNLMASDKAPTTSSSATAATAGAGVAIPETASACTSPGPTSPMLLSAAATAVIQSRYGKGAHDRYIVGYDPHGNVTAATSSTSSATNGIVLRPEKHATIPLQSFNLDCGRLDNTSGGSATQAAASATSSGGNVTKTNVAYLRTLSAPTPSPSHTIYQALLHNHSDNSNKSAAAAATRQLLGQRNSLAGGLVNAVAFDQPHHQQHHPLALTNFQSNEAATTTTDVGNNVVDIKSTMSSTKKLTPMTILKIEETSSSSAALAATALAAATAAASSSTLPATSASSAEFATGPPPTTATDVESLHQKRLRQLNMDMDNLRNTSIDQSQQLSALMQQNHYCTGGGNGSTGNKHKTLMTTSSCGMPKKASTTTTTTVVSSSPPMMVTCAATKQQQQQHLSQQQATASSYLLHGSDATKKGSTSTIWTSEESILRSVGAVDEDNNSTSSSACEEASGVLSSGKSGISLDSSGVENDNNESGIGTATPPKDMSYWKSMHPHHRHHHHHHHHHYNHSNQQDNESVSSLDALRKMKFQKGSSITSSDDPDLLEVLSLCDETHDDEDEGEDDEEELVEIEGQTLNKSLKSSSNNDEDMDDYDMVDEEDEGHDEFETIPYCDCECTEDGDNSSASAGSSGARTNSSSLNNGSLSDSTGGVVLRRKYAASPIMVPPKCRSHSLDTSSLPNSYHHVHQHQGHQHQHLHSNHHSHAQLARKLQHLRDRHKDRNQLSLALRQEPFQSLLAPTHFHELPSPSSASLHSGHEILDTQELSTKSNSAPLLLKQEKRRDDFANQNVTLRYSRSQSDRYLAEIEAVEACKWLRAAGFPQYAQMYEDHQFPIDLTNVAKDHTNLENDQLQSLYRRLCILNRCANMRVDQSHKAQTPQKEDSDDENFALSENWTFQRNIRRWSRIGEMGLEIPPAAKLAAAEKTESSSKESSPDRFEDDAYDVAGAPLSLTIPGTYTDDSADPALNDSTDLNASPLRRTGSERLKDGAKAILRRVESIKSRRRKRQGIVISGPQALDLSQLGQRSSVRKPDGVYSTPPSPSAVSPMHSFSKGPLFGNDLKVPSQSDNFLSPNRASPKRTPTTPRSMRTSPLHFFTNTMPYLKEGKSDDSSSYYSDSQESSSAVNKMAIRKTPSKTRRFLQRTGKVDDIGAHSDSECHQGRKLLIKDANANTTEVKSSKKLSRGGSLNLGRDGKKRDGFRSASFRSRSTTRKEPKPEETEAVKKTPVVRWHSFQLEERPHMIFRKCFAQKNDPHSNEHGILFAAMSAGQLQMIRKLALVTLTGYMERYCPTHRSGWNWELPKFIKKIKMPDYKDKKVFGVPLLLILQRSGQTLPVAVRAAFRWLQLNALDQIGLFRKSGVKSRILKLKELIEYSESSAECMDVFDTQQAYDVADMLKQYFRDLPESLLTTKMSETFAAIFQHLPPEVRLDAVQSAVLLLPDENREILYALLEFLTLVAANSQYNQMTANNLAVCLAPSLFHSSISTGSNSVTASPRRGKGKGSGVPDAKELFEAKASHECLSFMIDNYKQIYTAPKEKLGKCKFGYMEESKPLPLEALGEGMQFHNWRGYLYESTSATIKEGREKSRGWITTTSLADPSVEIGYKKVGDGHPLRLWRCITEIEGPPKDVLDYIIRQRASWDPNLLQSQTIKKFDDCTEIFQYAIDGQQCTDFCVLRSWRTDLPRGACVIVETSIDHAKAKPMFNAVRGVVLASRYLIEPCGSGRSRVMHLARVDVKGKTPEWYNKSYGHISSHFLTRIRLAFKNVADGPESKV